MEQLEPGLPKARPTLTACLNGPQHLRRRVLDAIGYYVKLTFHGSNGCLPSVES
jgi:hypothetical protein